MKKRNLTQRVTSNLAKGVTHTGKKAIHLGKKTANRIKENPKQAAKWGLKLKFYEALITGIAFGASTALMNNYTPQETPPQNIYQKAPIIRDDSKDILLDYIETELKFT